MTIDRAGIADRIPHKGRMCLLESVVHWDDTQITCTAVSHTDADNPLARDGMLSPLAGLEYGAQAMALHGALTGTTGATPKAGLIVSVRALRWTVRRLDAVLQPLTIDAQLVSGNGAQVSYDIAVREGERDLLTGRVMAILQKEVP